MADIRKQNLEDYINQLIYEEINKKPNSNKKKNIKKNIPERPVRIITKNNQPA